ncbi:hypothetical protein [Bifidobacterium callimiconis]|nr:hypothetical protein [Bifidobacterium callimiconis]
MTQPDDYDHRPESTSLFEWPLSADAERMSAGELLDTLFDPIRRLNREPAWPVTILPPRFGDVIVDRQRRTISALCMWKRKPERAKED